MLLITVLVAAIDVCCPLSCQSVYYCAQLLCLVVNCTCRIDAVIAAVKKKGMLI
jgi:hypothetical protein